MQQANKYQYQQYQMQIYKYESPKTLSESSLLKSQRNLCWTIKWSINKLIELLWRTM